MTCLIPLSIQSLGPGGFWGLLEKVQKHVSILIKF